MVRIRLRPYHAADVEPLWEAVHESSIEVSPWLPWCHSGYTREEARSWIAEQAIRRDTGEEYTFAVVDGEGGLLGGCGLSRIDHDRAKAEIGYWVRSSRMGQGIATEAVVLLMNWAWSHTDLRDLEIHCAVENIRSRAVAEKLGPQRQRIHPKALKIHGTWHDVIVYSFRSKAF